MACSSAKAAPRALAWLLPTLLGLLLLPGCEFDSYPEDLTYPPRTDPIVDGKADRDAPDIDRPGEYPKELFAYLPPEEIEKLKLLLDPLKVPAEQQQELDGLLLEIFGTPARPKVQAEGDLDTSLVELRRALNLDAPTLARGSQIYRQECLHCHGLSGDGRGATAPWVNPHPRDYRQGIFKFTSSKQEEGNRKPRREDLVRTVREGINGSSMPTFHLLPDDDIDAVVSYVIHLSLRGEVEYQVLRAALKDQLDEGIAGGVRDFLGNVAGNWLNAQKPENLIQPDANSYPTFKNDAERAASIRRGWQLFIQSGGPAGGVGCIGCHTDYGRQAPYKYDYWGTIVRPMDLTQGIYRGGSRPIDLFWRIHSGINGTGMTAFGQTLKSRDIWDVVNFLEILPYPQMRQMYGIKLEAD